MSLHKYFIVLVFKTPSEDDYVGGRRPRSAKSDVQECELRRMKSGEGRASRGRDRHNKTPVINSCINAVIKWPHAHNGDGWAGRQRASHQVHTTHRTSSCL